MSLDPTIARARIEIAGDRALLKELTDLGELNRRLQSKETKARIASLLRLITANEKLIDRINAQGSGGTDNPVA